MTRPSSSRGTGQKNCPTLNLGSMPCGCYAKGTPSPRRPRSWGSITPVCSNGWPGTVREGWQKSALTARWGKASLPGLPQPSRPQLRAQVAQGQFRTARATMQWVKETFGVQYQLKGMYSLLKRLKGKKKVPRPLATNTSLAAQAEWK